jgi:molybdopterin synthase catalytic subunit
MQHLIEKIKQHPDYHQAGMILCHEGVVRQNSRDGKKITGLRVHLNKEAIHKILAKYRKRPGIIDVLIEIHHETDLNVGDTIMFLVVAGDIRENVIATLSEALDDIKSSATFKTEYYESG